MRLSRGSAGDYIDRMVKKKWVRFYLEPAPCGTEDWLIISRQPLDGWKYSYGKRPLK